MKKTKKYMSGGMTPPAGGIPPEKAAMLQEAMQDPQKAAMLKQAMQSQMGGAAPAPAPRVTGLKKGGKVRGCGIAKKGVRKAKMR